MSKSIMKNVLSVIIQSSLFHTGSVSDVSDNLDWNVLYAELKAQTISGIPAEWLLSQEFLPRDIYNEWQKERIQQVGFFYRILYAQNELTRLLESENISTAILKGTAAAMYYPDPTARTMGDIDFLVAENDYKKAYQILLQHGYNLEYEEDHVDYHFTLQKDGLYYELHRRPAGMPEGERGIYTCKLIEQGLHMLDSIRIDGIDIPVLPAVQNGIVLLLHIVKHIKSGLGLRQIIDWMMYVNRELHDAEWYEKMQPVLHKIGYETLAKTITRMCQLYLGLPLKQITWCQDVDTRVCETLMDYIMEQGNFGRKVGEEDRGAMVLGEIDSPLDIFAVLQKRGKENWKLLKRYPILQPFAWLYMCLRYLNRAFRRNTPIRRIIADTKESRKRNWLFRQMRI